MDRVLSLWCIVWVIIRCCGRTHEAQFYQGCINATDSWKVFNINNESLLEPFSCVGLCSKERYVFAAVQNGSFCFCNSTIDHWINETECNIRCVSSPDLRCGGMHSQSVYSTAIPFIVSASLTPTSKTVQVNTTLSFKYSVLIRRPANEVMGLDSLQSNNKSLNNIYINWEINNSSLNFSTHLLNGNTTISSLNISLRRPGNFKICASAKNLVAQVKKCHVLDILLPLSGLHIVDINPKTQMSVQGHQNVSLISTKKPLYIKAAVSEGSNVTFAVSFGENTSFAVNLTSTRLYDSLSMGPTCVTIWHAYSYCGTYSISVSAFNAFSNQSLPAIPVVVQEMIKVILIDPASGLPGTSVELVVKPIGGCQLTYNWTFDDGSPSVTTQVPKVSHIFNATKKYKFKVRIYNSIGSLEESGFAYIQSNLTNVTISIDSPLSSHKNIYSTFTTFKFVAHLQPHSEAKNTIYEWFMRNHSVDSNFPNHESDFTVAGSFLAYVVAKNKVSRVKSRPVTIIIEDPISELKLKHVAKRIVPHEATIFQASMLGTNAMLIWDFGDGTVLTTNRTIVSHVYSKEKVYDVEVMAYNNVSYQNASLTTLVTKDDSCQPPSVQILRWQQTVVNRFEEVYFESEVTLDCDSTNKAVVYQWEIYETSNMKKLNNITSYLNEPTLIIPSFTLPYGKYAVKLRVHKEGTPGLYSKAVVEITVEKMGLVANIKEGSMRVVGYQNKQNVTLDGSSSFDPDYPEEKDKLSFKWACHLLSDNETKCFDPRFSLSLNNSTLTFPVQWLLPGKSGFFVVLTISKHGQLSKTAWQIIRMVDAEPHLLTVDCPQCQQGWVNPSDPLVLQGSCLTCPWNNKNLTFQWNLYLISNDGAPLPDPKCVSTVTEFVNKQRMTTAVTKRHTVKPPTTGWYPSRYFTAFTTLPFTGRKPTSNNYKTSRPDEELAKNQGFKVDKGEICSGPITIDPKVTPTTRCKFVPRNPSYGFGFRHHPTTSPGIWICSTTTEPFDRFKTHSRGFGSGTVAFTRPAGSATGHPHSPVPTMKGYPTSKPGITSPMTPTAPSATSSIGMSDSLYKPDFVVPTAQHNLQILSKHRLEILFPDSWSKTGRMDRDFVLLPGKLKAEYTYMLALNVKDNFKTNQDHRRGMANVFFKVNKNPIIGSCSIGPTSGYEMATIFGINCKRGIVQAKLSYQVTCKIQGDQEDESMLLYTGSNEHPTFRLPAGKREHGYKVSVLISMFNCKRTAVKVCPVDVIVRPSKYSPSKDLFLNKTKERIQTYIKVGDEQKVKQLVYILTKTFNRLNSSSKHQPIRTEMLGIMKQFRVRDEASAIQTGETIDAITSVQNEVDVEGLKIASEILSKVARHLKTARSINRVDYYERLVYLVTKLSSNLLSASSYVSANDSKSTQVQKLTQKVIFQALQLVIKTKLNHLMLGEKPMRLIHPSLGVLISKSLSVPQSKVELQNVSFLLPSNMVRHLGMNSNSYSSACLGTIMVVYEKSPYIWSDNQSLHKSKVSSLDLTSCHGDVKAVKNLSQEIEIDLPWVEYKDSEQENNFSVKWKHLNTHTIVNEMKNHSLQLKIRTLSELTNSLRLKVFVSTSEGEESLQNSQIFKSTAGGSVEFFFTSKQLINSSGTLRVGVIVGVIVEDSAQNRIKKIMKVSPVNYSFSSKWIGCFYWDKPNGNWSTQGCSATEKTSQFTVNCRCNHLTSFGAAAFLAPNQLKQIDLRKFISEDNIVATSLVVSIALLYMFLMIFCVRADRQDRRKEGVVDLTYAPCRNPHKYKIIVETGHWFGCGTTADIMIRLHGENATSDAIELVGNGKPVFQRGSTDAFLIKSPCDLSPLWKVHVWHYNQGDNPSWYLNRVIVKDMTTKEKWYFDCYRWLAVDQEDGKIDVELMANSGLKENRLQYFYHSCIQYLVDYHLWLSVAGKPPRSRFSRAQRLTCCLSLIMSTLCVSAAWYKTDDSNTKPLQLLGFLDITWNTVVLGIVCSLIVLPVNLIWIFMFRYAKPSGQKRRVHPSPTDDPITDTTCLPMNSATPDEDNLSLLDQTIETLLYLKSLGNKMRWQPSYMSERSSLDSFFATNSLDDEMSSISDPPNEDLGASKEAPWLTKPKVADIESNYKDQSCSTYSSGSFPQSEVKYGARKSFHLSFYFVYLGWFGCFATILSGAFFTMWYGVSFGRDKSYRWLQSLCISLVESLFVSQPIMVLAFLVFTLLSIYRTANKKDVVNDEDQDEGFQELPSFYNNLAFDRTHDNLKEALMMKRHQRYLKFLKPLEKSALSDTYEKKDRERAINSYFRELLLSIALLLLVCLLVGGLYCGCAFDIQNTVQKTILGRGNKGNNLSHRTVDQWWKDNHDRIVEVLYWRPMAWSSLNTTAPEIYFQNSQSVLVGRIRIRQFKAIERQVCVTNTSTSQLPEGNSSIMCWWTGAFDQGRWSSIELSRTKSKAMETVRQLTSIGWVSSHTQHISIEFVIFSPSQDVFSTVTWEITGQLSGVPKINIQVHTFRGTLKDTTHDVVLKVCKVLFVMTYFLYLYHEFSMLMVMKKKFFKSIAKYLTICCLLLSSLSVIVYIYWSVSLYNLFREMLTKIHDDVYSAGTVVYRNQELLIALYSLLIFMLVAKFVHLLTVFKFVQRFCYLLSATSSQLIGLMVIFVIFVLTFSHTGYLIFGRLNSNFKTFRSSFIYTSGLLRLVGQGHFVDTFYVDRPVFSILYLALYIGGLFVVLRGLSVSLYNVSYHSSKRRHFSTHVVIKYLLELYNGLCKAKSIEDEYIESDEDDLDDIDDTDGKQIIPVEYACDEVEFQMEELLFKLDNLAGTGGLKAIKLAYSSDILSGDEGDEEVEYLYRAGFPVTDNEFCGSGYESDQSFFSLGSANLEGLTDLEKERKISKDSSTVTISETSSVKQQRNFDKSDSPQMKLAALQKSKLTPKQLYRRNSDNSAMYSTDLKVESRVLQSSSGTSMSSRRPSLTKEFVKPKHMYPLTRKPKIRNGQMLLPEAALECEVPDSSKANVDDSTTSEDNEDRKSAKAKSKSSKKYSYRRALSLLPKTSVAPMSNDTYPPEKRHLEALRRESSLPSQSTSYNRRSSSSSDDTPRYDTSRLRNAFMFDENQRIDKPDLIHSFTEDIPPLSPSEPGFGVHSQDFFEAEDNLGFQMDSETSPPGLIQNICMNAEIGTSIVSIEGEDGRPKPIIRSSTTKEKCVMDPEPPMDLKCKHIKP